MIGRLLSERYKIIKTLSSGGMSQTYVAEDIQRPGNPICVVKQLRLETNTPDALEKARQLFNKEAETLERLGQHEQIPRLLAYFEREQDFYLVQELIRGHSIDHEMPLGERWSEPQVIYFLREVLIILEFVHSHNVIHLDIKPSNIIRRQSDQKLVLIDFGAVKQIQLQSSAYQEPDKTYPTVLFSIGTPGYMPTEQVIGKSYISSDIYALGMTAIQALTGISPLQLREDDDGEIVWRSQSKANDGLANVLTKMVHRSHKQRYQSAAETLQALQQFGLELNSVSTLIPQANSSGSLTQNHFYSPLTVDSTPNLSTVQQQTSGSSLGNPPTSEKTTVISSPKVASETSGNITTRPKKNRLLVGGVVVLLVSLLSGGGYAAYREIQRRDQQTQLDEIRDLKGQGGSEQCIRQAKEFSETYLDLYQEAENLLIECAQQLLDEAKKSAGNYSYLAAAEIATKIPPASRAVYEEAKKLSEAWHRNILQSAEDEYKKTCQVNTGISWAGNIPEDSIVYGDAQKDIKSWQEEETNNKALLTNAEQLLDENRDWNAAREKVNELKILGQPIVENSECWQRPEIKLVISKIESLKRVEEEEKRAEEQRQRAEEQQQRAEAAQRRNPLNVSTRLAQGEQNVNILDNRLYRDYYFEGRRGDRLNISMQSSDFDTYVCLFDPNDRRVDCSDDQSEDLTNSYIESVILSETGTYKVRAFSYAPLPTGQGKYSLVVTTIN